MVDKENRDGFRDSDDEDNFRRPDYFAPARSPQDACLRQIKGNYRRSMVRSALDTDSLESIPHLWRAQSLSKNLKDFLISSGPHALGGEDLPDLEEGEVEIARLTYVDSVHGEVVSLRARRAHGTNKILLRLVDEYDNDFTLEQDIFDEPLTKKELVEVFRTAQPSPFDAEADWSFSSFFYVDLDEVAMEQLKNISEESAHAGTQESVADCAAANGNNAARAIQVTMDRARDSQMSLDEIVEFIAAQPGATGIHDMRPAVVVVKFDDGSGVGVNRNGLDLLKPE